MIIRDAQIAVFEADQGRRFEDEVIAHLRECFGPMLEERYLDEVRLRLFVQEGIKRAERFGILCEDDVTRFSEYAVEYGEEFESLPWVAPVLTAADLTGDEKMDRLDDISAFTLR